MPTEIKISILFLLISEWEKWVKASCNIIRNMKTNQRLELWFGMETQFFHCKWINKRKQDSWFSLSFPHHSLSLYLPISNLGHLIAAGRMKRWIFFPSNGCPIFPLLRYKEKRKEKSVFWLLINRLCWFGPGFSLDDKRKKKILTLIRLCWLGLGFSLDREVVWITKLDQHNVFIEGLKLWSI